MRRYLFVMVGRNCAPWAARSVESVVAQAATHEIYVAAVDDASTDGTCDEVTDVLHAHREVGYSITARTERHGAMANQWHAWHEWPALLDGNDPAPDDVVVWVDLDDRLDDVAVCEILDRYYDAGALMSYGSYRAEPPSKTCAPARPYPPQAVRTGRFRDLTVAGGLHYNHCRSCSWEVLSQITEADCQDDSGNWWSSGPDAAVMLPALELSRERYAFVRECLYVYNSENPTSEWRDHPATVRANHKAMLARTPKQPPGGARPLTSAQRARERRRARSRR